MSLITKNQIRNLGCRFYKVIDNHEPIENFIELLSINNSDYKIVLPGLELKDLNGTTLWYKRMVGDYFNGSHMIYSVDLDSANDHSAVAKIVLVWTASLWKPPASKSESVNILTYTTWKVEKVSEGGDSGLKIISYVIDRLDFAPGTMQQTPH